ncbi:CRISPR-associated endoribonuclease Cas6 [Laceyella putida]|uniref:CRISPR-associated endoribonuclease n=1 Tax=Laceyella putida TaxID=110101 RepID=A0ABW2RM56_9BACL
MRIEVTYEQVQPLALPYDLNYALTSYLYYCLAQIDEGQAKWLHDEGITFAGRSYKPLVTSRLQFQSLQTHRTHMMIQGEVKWRLDSIQPELIQNLIQGIWSVECLRLPKARIPLRDVRILEQPTFTETMQYEPLSPIVVPVQQGERLHYCHPLESQFYDSLRQSISQWYQMKWGEPMGDQSIHVSVLEPARSKLSTTAVLTTFKRKKLKGYLLPLEIQADPNVQQVIYESGLGSYGFQGFGMMEVRK